MLLLPSRASHLVVEGFMLIDYLGYILAFTLGAFIAWHTGDEAFGIDLGADGKAGKWHRVRRAAGFSVVPLASIIPLPILSNWQIKNIGPDVGLCWTVGIIFGYVFVYIRTVDAIADRFSSDMSPQSKRILKRAVRDKLIVEGRNMVNGSLPGIAKQIRDDQARQATIEQALEKNRQLQSERDALKKDNRHLESKVQQKHAEVQAVDEARTRSLNVCRALVNFWSQLNEASVRGEMSESAAKMLLRSALTEIVTFGGSKCVSAAIYLLEAKDEVLPWVCSNSATQIKTAARPLSRRESVLSLIDTHVRPFSWPESQPEIAPEIPIDVKSGKGKRGEAARLHRQNYPTCYAVPVPLFEGISDSGKKKHAYAAIIVTFSDNDINSEIRMAALGLACVVETLIGTPTTSARSS